MFAIERQQKIMEHLSENGVVSVGLLSKQFGVVEETIRRDLEKLETQGKLMRTHGGAVPVDDVKHEPSIERRKTMNVEGKKKVAKAAAALIEPGDTIFLDASTTTYYIAQELREMRDITVVTTSLQSIALLSNVDGIKLIATGGIVGDNQSFIGSLAEESVRRNYFADKVFFSSRGVTLQAGVLDSNEQEAAIKRCMMENSRKAIFVCDHTKLNRVGFAKLAAFDEIDAMVTEPVEDNAWTHCLSDAGCDLIEAE